MEFCEQSAAIPLPTTEKQLCRFVAYLREEGLRYQTVKTYLAAVRHMQISHEMGDPKIGSMARLELVVRGMKREQAGLPTRARLPITPEILNRIQQHWKGRWEEWDVVMLWAAMTLCFYGFLRAGEVVVPSDTGFDPAQHLTYDDIAVDSKQQPSFITVNIKQSKTDPFRKGVTIVVGRAVGPLCPLVAVLTYMAIRRPGQGPLFRFSDGRPLTRERFVAKVREVLQQIGIDQTKYAGHSFRIGAATTAAKKGIQDSLIKTLGRWESVAYQLYVRTPREQLVAVAATLSGSTDST